MIIQCKMCGGDLKLTDGSSIAKCEYCGTLQTVPISSGSSSKKINLFDRANKLRIDCDFDQAESIYSQIIAEYPEEAEAYWGSLLCKYGIEYVDDPQTELKVPTCHRLSFDRVQNEETYNKALELADDNSKGLYESEGKQIESIRSKIIEVSSKEAPYDVFICYKESDENNNRTEDSVIAEKIYEELTSRDYRVFFSKISLEEKIGQEYEPYIFAALNSAKVMLVVGTSYQNINSTWVKNEWSRYLSIIKQDKDKVLVPCYKGMNPYDLPKEFTGLQAQDMGKIGANEDLARGISKIIPRGTQKVGITEDDLKSVLKKESRKRSLRSIIIFCILGLALAIGVFWGVKALITMIQNNKQTIVNENYYERDRETDPTPTPTNTPTPTSTPTPTPSPTPTPIPVPLSVQNLTPQTVWIDGTEHFTVSYDVVGAEGEDYRLQEYYSVTWYENGSSHFFEIYPHNDTTGEYYMSVHAGTHVNPHGGSSGGCAGSVFWEGRSLNPGIYTCRVYDYDTGRLLASDELRIE
ncbi:MAG: toll/interleukin-1 receptor domain-containing protein [Clostridiales bacterium]|nr:toll/interleukin-1 receptor domain-containing protein [Clostridiales bacterium]